MKIDHLIRKGRVDPILEVDDFGVEMLVGWRRKPGSRFGDQAFRMNRPMAWVTRGEPTPGVRIVMAERRRQKVFEGFDDERDDGYVNGELAQAAECYERDPSERVLEIRRDGIDPPEGWPWDSSWWKPGLRIRELAKAGALYLAEHDRLSRAGLADEAAAMAKRSVGCASGIDNIYRVSGLSPGPHMLR